MEPLFINIQNNSNSTILLNHDFDGLVE
jgi:hypothetical protein